MIKFFRKIRQNLLLENKTGKYFKYAIGEIVLVVIGILIALSINNWNENRIQKQNALILCERLLEETENTIPIIEADIKECKVVLSADLGILNMMGENYRSQDSRKLDSLMSFTLLGPNLNVKNSVLNQALNNAALMSEIDVELKNTIYEIPLLVEAAKKTERSISTYVNEMVSIMSSTYSLRTMDVTFSPSMKDVGFSKFNKDSREILSVFKFENNLDNKYFLINALTEEYKKILDGYKVLKYELQSNIDQLKS